MVAEVETAQTVPVIREPQERAGVEDMRVPTGRAAMAAMVAMVATAAMPELSPYIIRRTLASIVSKAITMVAGQAVKADRAQAASQAVRGRPAKEAKARPAFIAMEQRDAME
jgi:putative ribosome biogenesis GTPase RsgA